ncbi:energy transducer TonB [Caulobacter mirabilis]|uniref:TonB C-terminal domain-containing protein n=1 Tax=Caulobacter mirabilis TaxID=69666 RepID=A0A2D2B2X6_9CAUL|nr:TonB family protein [Caulobacter mirabilis]ATQ44605.1 hypothetical protein CSW64_20520 [Caulobacter mirabilis]
MTAVFDMDVRPTHRPWRRDAVVLAGALAFHAVLVWALFAHSPGLSVRPVVVSLDLMEPLGAPSTWPSPRRGGAAKGEEAGGGQEAEIAPRPAGAETGSGRQGQDAGPAVPTPDPALAKALAEVSLRPADSVGEGAGEGRAGVGGQNAYQRRLQRHIRPFRLYPSEAVVRRAEGLVLVRFRVARDGSVEEAWVVGRSGDAALDQAALETLWRAEPMPVVPDDLPAPVEIELPVPFRLPGR